MKKQLQYLTTEKARNGEGVFARKHFTKGETIIQFRGALFTRTQLPTPYDQVQDHYVQMGSNLYRL